MNKSTFFKLAGGGLWLAELAIGYFKAQHDREMLKAELLEELREEGVYAGETEESD